MDCQMRGSPSFLNHIQLCTMILRFHWARHCYHFQFLLTNSIDEAPNCHSLSCLQVLNIGTLLEQRRMESSLWSPRATDYCYSSVL